MYKYVLNRLVRLLFTLVIIITVIFIMMHLTPGDPVEMMLGAGSAPETVKAIRHKYGLDKPIYLQYLDFWIKICKGDLGISWRTGTGVKNNVLSALKYTMLLAFTSMLIATVTGLFTGIWSALKKDKFVDNFLRTITLFGISMPTFLLGIALMYFFSYKFGLFPTFGAIGIRSLVLPATTLSLFITASITRLVRSTVLDILNKEYVIGARAKGFSENYIITRIVFKNAAVIILTILGLQFGMLLGGSVITETVFSWPGIGQLMIEGIKFKDVPIVQACVLFFAIGFMLVNLTVDLLYSFLDPRIKY